ncbi:MAG: C4-dicarboxylate ABC transporter [Alphaproteobacteria bacterium]|nr:MAG: C4-dicarboxylate ABC transporter [Alphaproteobacteria bacterium]
MYPKLSRVLFIAILILLFQINFATAQAIPKSIQQGGNESTIKERKNAWTVGIAGGLIDGTYMRFADELAKVLDDGDNLRILPMVSYGAASNLDDLLYLRGVDLAVTQSDVFEYFRTERKTPNLQNRIHYILRLPIAELHILAKTEIRSLEDLRGKKVNFGPAGSGSSLTGTIVFQRLGVQVDQVLIDQQSALQKLRSGEVDALVRVVGKPVDFFTRIPPNSGLHLVPIPYTKTFADYYTVGELEAEDYPALIAEGEKIETIAVPAVLSVFNWPKASERYRRIERFTERLFANWDEFLVAPRHPKWRDVNLGATVPGWTRHTIAQQMLERFYGPSGPAQEDISRDFQAFLNRIGTGAPASQADREVLFRQFLQWREQQSRRTR